MNFMKRKQLPANSPSVSESYAKAAKDCERLAKGLGETGQEIGDGAFGEELREIADRVAVIAGRLRVYANGGK